MADEVALSFREFGRGEPLVLLHGWGISFTIWRELIPLLSPHFRVIVVELPGIGASRLPESGDYYQLSALALERLRQQLHLETWAILGYSLGGWTARNYARRWPQRVSALAYLNVACPGAPAAAGLALLFALDRALPAFGSWFLTRWRLKFLVRLLGFNGAASPLGALWVQEIGVQSLAALKRSLRDIPAWGLGNLRMFDGPTAFVWGRTDLIGVAPLWPGKRDVVLRGTHALPMTNAPAIAQTLVPFFRV